MKKARFHVLPHAHNEASLVAGGKELTQQEGHAWTLQGERTSEEHELHVRVLVPDAGAAGEGCKGAVENVNRCIVLAQPPPQLSNLQAPVTRCLGQFPVAVVIRVHCLPDCKHTVLENRITIEAEAPTAVPGSTRACCDTRCSADCIMPAARSETEHRGAIAGAATCYC